MIVEIETYKGDMFFSGKCCSEEQIRQIMKELECCGSYADVMHRNGFEKIYGESILPDYVIDMDIYKIYIPKK